MSESSRRNVIVVVWALFCVSSLGSAWFLRAVHVSRTSFELAAAIALSALSVRLTVGFAPLARLSESERVLSVYTRVSWGVVPVASLAVAYTSRFGGPAATLGASLAAFVGYCFFTYLERRRRLVLGATLAMALELGWQALTSV